MNTQNVNVKTATRKSTERWDEKGTVMAPEKKDLYQRVTDTLIAALEVGVKPWVCPWQRKGMSSLPCNYTTGHHYQGMNILLLWHSATTKGYTDPRWLTYRQAKDAAGQVRRGEQGTTIFYYSMREKEREDGEVDHIPLIKTFTVFNYEQIDGLAVSDIEMPEIHFNSQVTLETFFEKSGAKIREKGEAAYFNPTRDEIILPARHLFSQAADFYATGLHELVHWSGAKTRLNREMKGKFGSADYAFEELIAELGSAFLMAHFGVQGEVQHESYIASWLKALKNDKRFIFKAASFASKAHQYLIDKSK